MQKNAYSWACKHSIIKQFLLFLDTNMRMRILESSCTKKCYKYSNKPIKNSSFVGTKKDTHVPQTSKSPKPILLENNK